jgi:hypothetical protein
MKTAMKKVYFAPQTEILEYMTEEMIAASGVISEDPFDIGYGGVDEKGLDPESRIPFGNVIFGD